MGDKTKIGIIGSGLIGGSLAAALKKHDGFKVYCWNRRIEVSQKALELGYVDEYFNDLPELAKASDILILNTPLNSYPSLINEISPALDEDKIISDVGSVKFRPSEEVLAVLPEQYRKNFVPAHPIAGSEKTGVEAAKADLFQNKKLIITPFENTSKDAVKKIAMMWKQTGANIIELSPEKHDDIYAKVSHLPQFISFAYKDIFAKMNFEVEQDEYYKEFTRLTHSDKNLWRDIFFYNRDNLKNNISSYCERLKANVEIGNIPQIIAKSLEDIITAEELDFAGTGLKSFLAPLSDDFRFVKHENSFILEFISKLIKRLDEKA